jgi:hypothetical protein
MSIVIVLALTVPGVLFCVWFELALLRDESVCAVAYHIEFKDILQDSLQSIPRRSRPGTCLYQPDASDVRCHDCLRVILRTPG